MTSHAQAQLTVIYPMLDLRGRAADHVGTWTRGQTLARDQYRVLVVHDGTQVSPERDLAPLFDSSDKLVCVPGANDAGLWNAGARNTQSRWLVFTEGHCLADGNCLEATRRWIAENPEAQAGNFQTRHDDRGPLATMNRRWTDAIQEGWRAPGAWPQLHRAGLLIRGGVLEASGGFEAEYGQFAPALLSSRLHAHGIRIEPIPGAVVLHLGDER